MSLTTILLAILAIPSTGALAVGIRSLWKWFAKGKAGRLAEAESTRVHNEVAAANASVLVVAQSQQQLVADNERLRAEMREKDTRHAAERAEWAGERTQMRGEIDALENRMHDAIRKLNEALIELQQWRRRYGTENESA